jgi:hypothetical protein
MPMMIVTIIPPGSGPGMIHLASAPAMSPTMIQNINADITSSHLFFFLHFWQRFLGKAFATLNMTENNKAVKGWAVPSPLFTELPTRRVPGNPLGPVLVVYPSRSGRSDFSLHRTGRMAMLHTLRGRFLTGFLFCILPAPQKAGDHRRAPLRPFSCSPPVLMHQDRPGVPHTNFCIILVRWSPG